MGEPKRIQLRRTKGWRLPDGARSCARPCRFGNPFVYHGRNGLVAYGPSHLERYGRAWDHEGRISRAGTRHDHWWASGDVVETHVRWATKAELVELHLLTLTDPTPGMVRAWPSNQGRFCTVTVEEIQAELAGLDLACWCRLDEPCHVDNLLMLANQKGVTGG